MTSSGVRDKNSSPWQFGTPWPRLLRHQSALKLGFSKDSCTYSLCHRSPSESHMRVVESHARVEDSQTDQFAYERLQQAFCEFRIPVFCG